MLIILIIAIIIILILFAYLLSPLHFQLPAVIPAENNRLSSKLMLSGLLALVIMLCPRKVPKRKSDPQGTPHPQVIRYAKK